MNPASSGPSNPPLSLQIGGPAQHPPHTPRCPSHPQKAEGAGGQRPQQNGQPLADGKDLLTFYRGLERFGNCHHHVGAKDLGASRGVWGDHSGTGTRTLAATAPSRGPERRRWQRTATEPPSCGQRSPAGEPTAPGRRQRPALEEASTLRPRCFPSGAGETAHVAELRCCLPRHPSLRVGSALSSQRSGTPDHGAGRFPRAGAPSRAGLLPVSFQWGPQRLPDQLHFTLRSFICTALPALTAGIFWGMDRNHAGQPPLFLFLCTSKPPVWAVAAAGT